MILAYLIPYSTSKTTNQQKQLNRKLPTMANLAFVQNENIKKRQEANAGGNPRQREILRSRTNIPIGGGFAENGIEGHWKHDKFFEVYGGKRGFAKKQPGLNHNGKSIADMSCGQSNKQTKQTGIIPSHLARNGFGGGQKAIIKLQVCNLPESVMTSDLEVQTFIYWD
jgi:hypothetical protein